MKKNTIDSGLCSRSAIGDNRPTVARLARCWASTTRRERCLDWRRRAGMIVGTRERLPSRRDQGSLVHSFVGWFVDWSIRTRRAESYSFSFRSLCPMCPLSSQGGVQSRMGTLTNTSLFRSKRLIMRLTPRAKESGRTRQCSLRACRRLGGTAGPPWMFAPLLSHTKERCACLFEYLACLCPQSCSAF